MDMFLTQGPMMREPLCHAGEPLVPMTTVHWVRNLIDALDACGLDGMALAQHAGIKPESLDLVESGVWVKEIVRLWELAVEGSGNEAIGLLAAHSFRPSGVGVTGYVMMASADLRGALQGGIRYSGAISSATTASLSDAGDGWRFAFHIMSGIVDTHRQNHEYVLSSLLKFFRWIAGQDLVPARVEFMHARPADLSAYQAFFRCPLLFGAAHTALVFSAADMARPLLTSNPQLLPVLEQTAERCLAQMGRSEMTQRIRQLIVQALPQGEPTRDGIAEGLGISSRTLQRRLQDEGQSFHQLLEDVRVNLAERYLSRPDISLADVAGLLGFSDQSSFTRAAHRWFDASPSSFRAGRLAQHRGG